MCKCSLIIIRLISREQKPDTNFYQQMLKENICKNQRIRGGK